MSRNLRCRPRISYHEREEPDFDEYVFCDGCGDYLYEYCSIHGSLLVMPDDKVPSPTGFPSFVPRAALTIPQEFLHLAPSTIPGAGLGVFASLTLPKGVRFGPYCGQRIEEATSEYCWQIYDGSNHRRPLYMVDARDPQRSNWMRYVNCSRHWAEQNLIAYQYRGKLYYRTIKIVPRMTELMVFYGAESARALRIDLRLYNNEGARYLTTSDLQAMGNQAEKKNATFEKPEVVEKIAANLDSPSTSTDKNNNQEINEKTDTQFFTTDNKDNKKDGFMKNYDQRLLDNNKQVNTNSIVCTAIEYSCTLCKFKPITAKLLDSHLKAHSAVRRFICDSCSYICTKKCSLIRHIRKHTGEKQYACDMCDKKFSERSHLNTHIRTHTGEKSHACGMCDKRFSERRTLIRHIRTHTGEKPHACGMCDKRFSERRTLIQHIRTHTGEKPHACGMCDKRFSERRTLIQHIRTHTGEKPHACGMCDKRFSERRTLIRHIRTHTGEKPHACGMCDKRFSERRTLIQHIKTHTGEKPHACGMCDKRFSERRTLIRHIRTHTGEKPHACEVCSVKFSDRRYLNNHNLRIHKS